MKELLRYLNQERSRHLDELTEYLKIQSISTRSEHKADMKRAADWTAAQLKGAGLLEVKVHRTAGHPIVTGRTPEVKGAPTVLVYGHYDVQPVEPLELWDSDPFSPEVRKGKLFGRGSADDKGQLFIYLKVLEAFKKVKGGVPVNVKVLAEGEEEIGSPSLVPFLKQNAKLLACDLILVSDTHMLGIRDPSITVGLRGLTALEVTVKSLKGDQHSGTYGGALANPCQVLAEMLVSCKDPKSGKVKIPGFYDDARKMSKKERVGLTKIPHDDGKFLRSVGGKALFGERGFTTLERLGARPTFEINGIWGGYTGEGVKTVLPSEAHAKISMRLVPFQNPDKVGRAAKAHLEAVAPDHVQVTVKREKNQGFASWIDPDFSGMKVASAAVKKAFGKEPVFTLEGGSIPIVAEFKKVLGSDTILLGFGLPDDNLHAPNEKFDLRMLDKGMKTVAHFFNGLGESA